MPAQRTPGALGLWSDPSASGDGPWAPGWARTASPSGPASDALCPVTPVGLESPVLGVEVEEEAPATVAAPPERYRYMEVQGELIKVRCCPLDQAGSGWRSLRRKSEKESGTWPSGPRQPDYSRSAPHWVRTPSSCRALSS